MITHLYRRVMWVKGHGTHNDEVSPLCPLKGNRLLSGGGDCIIKVWTLSNVELTLIKKIEGYTD